MPNETPFQIPALLSIVARKQDHKNVPSHLGCCLVGDAYLAD